MNEEIAALIALHQGLDRLGPGDPEFSRQVLSGLPALPVAPRIADFGAGSGAGTLLLAECYGVPVTAVDLSRVFLDRLESRAAQRGLAHLIQTLEADMGGLDWPAGSVDLLWSEGAAYNLTFTGALKAWRPLLAPGGLAVISELSWFSDTPPDAPRAFWAAAYPAMGTEEKNARSACETGFEVLSMQRLPAGAWWTLYYDPLQARIKEVCPAADPTMIRVIQETEAEMDLFRNYSAHYGYTFYVLRAR